MSLTVIFSEGDSVCERAAQVRVIDGDVLSDKELVGVVLSVRVCMEPVASVETVSLGVFRPVTEKAESDSVMLGEARVGELETVPDVVRVDSAVADAPVGEAVRVLESAPVAETEDVALRESVAVADRDNVPSTVALFLDTLLEKVSESVCVADSSPEAERVKDIAFDIVLRVSDSVDVAEAVPDAVALVVATGEFVDVGDLRLFESETLCDTDVSVPVHVAVVLVEASTTESDSVRDSVKVTVGDRVTWCDVMVSVGVPELIEPRRVRDFVPLPLTLVFEFVRLGESLLLAKSFVRVMVKLSSRVIDSVKERSCDHDAVKVGVFVADSLESVADMPDAVLAVMKKVSEELNDCRGVVSVCEGDSPVTVSELVAVAFDDCVEDLDAIPESDSVMDEETVNVSVGDSVLVGESGVRVAVPRDVGVSVSPVTVCSCDPLADRVMVRSADGVPESDGVLDHDVVRAPDAVSVPVGDGVTCVPLASRVLVSVKDRGAEGESDGDADSVGDCVMDRPIGDTDSEKDTVLDVVLESEPDVLSVAVAVDVFVSEMSCVKDPGVVVGVRLLSPVREKLDEGSAVGVQVDVLVRVALLVSVTEGFVRVSEPDLDSVSASVAVLDAVSLDPVSVGPALVSVTVAEFDSVSTLVGDPDRVASSVVVLDAVPSDTVKVGPESVSENVAVRESVTSAVAVGDLSVSETVSVHAAVCDAPDGVLVGVRLLVAVRVPVAPIVSVPRVHESEAVLERIAVLVMLVDLVGTAATTATAVSRTSTETTMKATVARTRDGLL